MHLSENPVNRRLGFRPAQAFTRCDVSAVIGAVGMLCLLQISGIASSRGGGQTITCLSNLKAMTAAWFQHAEDHGGQLVGNLDGGEVQTLSNSNRTWVLGWIDFSGGSTFPASAGGSSDTNVLLLTQYSPLANYLGHSARVFKCPADKSLNIGRTGAPRVRSIAMNGYMGSRPGPYTAGFRQITSLSQIVSPSPSERFVFLDERDDSLNDAWFPIDMTGFNSPSPRPHAIVDFPAEWHNGGGNLSFADGHAENWHWKDPRTTPPHRPGKLLTLGVFTPENPDVARLQHAATSKNGSL